MKTVEMLGKKAKEASRALAVATQAQKNNALLAIANELQRQEAKITAANAADMKNGAAAGLSSSLLDRLYLDSTRIAGMAQGIRSVAAQEDPVGRVISGRRLANGLQIEQVTVPLGVIGIIYEARPNVTADAAALCLKAGNAVILRGGKEAINSNRAIAEIMRAAVHSANLPEDCIALIEDVSRESANELMQLSGYLDVLIPRGGAGLIRSVVQNARVPVIETGAGNCHVYVDEFADVDMAAQIIFNAKTSRPSVCNAIETVLVHQSVAAKALTAIKLKLDEKNVELRGCERTREILGEAVAAATEDDYEREFLDYVLALKVVDSIDDALAHIAKYSTRHSDCIITESYTNAARFINEVDSAAVYVNASTRFTDGGEFGLGAEIGISTQKLHARGPMGAQQLTSTKFVVRGSGQIR